ncbi:MAG: hypothetical protein Q7U07_03420 [Gammaproteobacteria bacterium]|nr:hypothetical protein [Gammaproteobacteria bacterium]
MDNVTLQILERLNTLYTNAFSQLITYTIGLVALVGLLIPLAMTLIQNRAFRREGEAVTKWLQDEAKKIREELKLSLREELLKESGEIEKRFTDILTQKNVALTKKIANTDAGVFHVQAAINAQQNFYPVAVVDYASAGSNYLIGEDELNLRRVLVQVVSMLSLTDKTHLKDHDEIESTVKSLIKSLEANNINGRYSDSIHDIEKALKEAQERQPQE